MRISQLVARNLKASPVRTVTVMVAVAVVVSLLFSTTVLDIGVSRSASVGAARFGADLMIVPPVVAGITTFQKASSPIFIVPLWYQYLDGSTQSGVERVPGI